MRARSSEIGVETASLSGSGENRAAANTWQSHGAQRRLAVYAAGLAVITLIVYGSVVSHKFVYWDDDAYIIQNPHLNPPALTKVAIFWRQPFAERYIPLTYSLWAAMALLARENRNGVADLSPRPFHALNLFLHMLSALVVFFLLRAIIANDRAAFWGALLFSLHPVQAEATSWISCMDAVLGGLLSLLALWQYLLFAQADRAGMPTGRKAAHYAAGIMFLILALLSRPSTFMTPAIAVVLDCALVGRSARKSLAALSPWMGLALIKAVSVVWLQADVFDADFVAPIWARPLIAADALVFYARQIAVPAVLAIDYGRTPLTVLKEGPAHATFVVACGMISLAWLAGRRHPPLLAAGGVFVIALLPFLGLVPFDFQGYSTVADRYLYLSMLGPAMAVSFVLARCGRRGEILFAVALTALGFISARQATRWRNTNVLMNHTLQVNPRSWIAHQNLAIALMQRGKHDQAMNHLKQAMRLKPNLALSWNAMGALLARQGRASEAIEHFSRALEINPNSSQTHDNLGFALAAQGKLDDAIDHFATAVRLNPYLGRAQLHLGRALAQKGKHRRAIRHLRRACQILPDDAGAHCELASALARSGHSQEALHHFQQALRINPNFEEAHRGLTLTT